MLSELMDLFPWQYCNLPHWWIKFKKNKIGQHKIYTDKARVNYLYKILKNNTIWHKIYKMYHQIQLLITMNCNMFPFRIWTISKYWALIICTIIKIWNMITFQLTYNYKRSEHKLKLKTLPIDKKWNMISQWVMKIHNLKYKVT